MDATKPLTLFQKMDFAKKLYHIYEQLQSSGTIADVVRKSPQIVGDLESIVIAVKAHDAVTVLAKVEDLAALLGPDLEKAEEILGIKIPLIEVQK